MDLRPFDRSEQAIDGGLGSERLVAFHKAMWDALVPAGGECVSVQGELVRGTELLTADLLCEGMGKYYEAYPPDAALRDTHLGKLLFFMLDPLIENRGGAMDAEDVAFFAATRELVEPDWHARRRYLALTGRDESEEPTPEEEAKLAEAEDAEYARERPPFTELFDRFQRCVANWCIRNPELVDRRGRPVEERGIRDVRQVLAPPPPPPKCALCNGRGWIAPRDASSFPVPCACKAP